MLGSHEDDPVGWAVPVHASLIEPLLLGGIPRMAAILLGSWGAAFGLYITLWVVPGALIAWVGLAVWTRHDPEALQVFRRFWTQKRHYYG